MPAFLSVFPFSFSRFWNGLGIFSRDFYFPKLIHQSIGAYHFAIYIIHICSVVPILKWFNGAVRIILVDVLCSYIYFYAMEKRLNEIWRKKMFSHVRKNESHSKIFEKMPLVSKLSTCVVGIFVVIWFWSSTYAFVKNCNRFRAF